MMHINLRLLCGSSRLGRWQRLCSLGTRRLSTASSSDSTVAGNSVHAFVEEGKFVDCNIDNVRTFSVIAHVDHGKSTLADCILQKLGNISVDERKQGQYLDNLDVERERGITVRAQTATMVHHSSKTGKDYILNLIDTPGHVDFSNEVSKSLGACQGALLLVDSTQSIQAQTLANYNTAKKLGLAIVPVITKMDLPSAQPEETALSMSAVFGFDPDQCIMTSAKKFEGIDEVIDAIVDKIPSPSSFCGDKAGDFKGRIIDSWYEEHRGVVCLVHVVSGTLKENQRITAFAMGPNMKNRTEVSVQEIGIMTPKLVRTKQLTSGQVGYIVSGMRSTREACVGDTLYIPGQWKDKKFEPLPGYAPAKQMLFASIFPTDPNDLDRLYSSVDRLCLTDSSVSAVRDQSATSLGSGMRCGFLGFLHMEVFLQRLEDDFGMSVVMTSPSVKYKVLKEDGCEIDIQSISEFPEKSKHSKLKVLEPMVKVTLFTPAEFYGDMVDALKFRRSEEIETTHLDDGSLCMTALTPWQEVVYDMHDVVKKKSSGYANFDYTEAGYKISNLEKVTVAVNGIDCEALSFIAHASKAQSLGRKISKKLKDVLKRQQFEIVLQAKIGSKVISRERLAPFRKDVLASGKGTVVGGGDVTRKKKLLEKQKEGKKRAKKIGKVEISQEAFWAVLNRKSS